MQKKSFKINIMQIFANYPTYFIVGSFNALLTIILREMIGIYINDTSLLGFTISMVFAYSLGILLGFTLHSYFTFPRKIKYRKNLFQRILYFYGSQAFGMTLTILLSLLIRRGLLMFNIFHIFQKFDSTIAFGIAAILTSIATYIINKILIFRVH